jgi:hypothetical protein
MGHYWGRKDCSANTETMQNKGFSASKGKNLMTFKIKYDPFIFAKNRFSKIQYNNRDMDMGGFMCPF